MKPWRVPARDEILPVSEEQSCVVCGSDDWAWLYVLLHAPDWVQHLGWFGNWFIVMCDECHEAWTNGPEATLQARWDLYDVHTDDAFPSPPLAEWRAVVTAMQSEPPLPRHAVVGWY